MQMRLFSEQMWHLVYDGEGDGGDPGIITATAAEVAAAAAAAAAGGTGDAGTGDGTGDGAGASGGTGDDKEIKLTQGQLNKMMADNRRKLTTANATLITQLEEIRGTANMSEEQRTELETRIDTLQKQYLTKEELREKEIKKQATQRQTEIENLVTERDSWRTRYAQSTIKRSLQDAAISVEALQPQQIVAILGANTRLAEVVGENGAATGDYAPVVSMQSVDKDGQPIELELAPAEAVKLMKEQTDLYGNLFKGTAKGGMGTTGGGTGNHKHVDLKDPAKYVEWRKKNPNGDPSEYFRK